MREDGPPVRDGFLSIRRGQIVGMSDRPEPRCQEHIFEIEDCCLCPPLVNAHCHLDLSDIENPIAVTGNFADWITSVIQHRAFVGRMPPEAQIAYRARSVQSGLQQSQHFGVGKIFDIVAGYQRGLYPPQLAEQKKSDAVIVVPLAELIDVTPTRRRETINAAKSLFRDDIIGQCGLSPHAPYTTTPKLLTLAAKASRRGRFPLAMHVAESQEELQWLEQNRGPLADLLAGFAPAERVQDSVAANRFNSIEEIISKLGRSHRSLLIHGNHLNDDQIQLLASLRDRIAVVYCPRTHAAFHHREHPLPKLLAAGVEVLLGTDSLASSPDLDLLKEAQLVRQQFPAISAVSIFAMITNASRQFFGEPKQFVIGGSAGFTAIKVADVSQCRRSHEELAAAILDCGVAFNVLN